MGHSFKNFFHSVSLQSIYSTIISFVVLFLWVSVVHYAHTLYSDQNSRGLHLLIQVKEYLYLLNVFCYSRDSDSESSGSGPVDVSVLGCDSDWDSDLSDSDPSRCSRLSGIKSAAVSQPQRDPAEPDWDMYGEVTEAEVPTELFTQQDRNNDSRARTVTKVTTCMAATPDDAMATQPTTTQVKLSSAAEPSTTTKKVTWQFKPAQRSVCTGSRKEKEKEFTPSSSYGRFNEMGGDELPRSRHSPSSSSSSSPSLSSSSG